jgi:hypothetical protein
MLKVLIGIAVLMMAGAAWGQDNDQPKADPTVAFVHKILNTSCASGIEEACNLRDEDGSPDHLMHLQEFFTGVCRMGSSDYPITDDDEKTACNVRDAFTQALKDHGYQWNNDEKFWFKPSAARAPEPVQPILADSATTFEIDKILTEECTRNTDACLVRDGKPGWSSVNRTKGIEQFLDGICLRSKFGLPNPNPEACGLRNQLLKTLANQ